MIKLKNPQNKKQFFVSILFLLYFFSQSSAQDPVSSHHFLTNSFTNPAFSGLQNNINLTLNYRNQWPGMGNAFNTFKAGVSGIKINDNNRAGLILSRDITGEVFSTTGLDVYYNFITETGLNSKIIFAFQSSIYQTSINDPGLNNIPDWSNNYTATPAIANTHFYPDFSSSVAYQKNQLIIGFGVFHLTAPKTTRGNELSKLNRKYNITASYEVLLKSPYKKNYTSLTPLIHVESQQNERRVTTGVLMENDIFGAGIFLRQLINPVNSSTIILSSKFNFLNSYIVYSFDVLLINSYLTIHNFGVHEVTLGYKIEYKRKIKGKNNTINCPY